MTCSSWLNIKILLQFLIFTVKHVESDGIISVESHCFYQTVTWFSPSHRCNLCCCLTRPPPTCLHLCSCRPPLWHMTAQKLRLWFQDLIRWSADPAGSPLRVWESDCMDWNWVRVSVPTRQREQWTAQLYLKEHTSPTSCQGCVFTHGAKAALVQRYE